METDRWEKIEELFHRAADLSPDRRDELLEGACAGDAALRSEVERLLRDDATDGDVFDRLDDSPRRLPPDPNVGRMLGAYRLTERLGEGGMGLVYRAERVDGLFDQQVAVKLVRIERATDELVRRFEFERRTLASLNHPNIARLYDGGTSEEGFPYIVMEYVAGEPIDEYCDRRHLSVDERLRLFATVCRAVHFAHQNLVIHRDLKPPNILIDEHGVPKLLDFGIARLVDESEEAAAQLTRTLARILTPEYASPEQLTGGATTTAMDVYALGVVLYGLLTGLRPFRCDSRSPMEWHRLVLETTPTRPSTAVGRSEPDAEATPETLAARCGVTPAQLRRRLRGDLDRIVLMALRKEPERRFASVQELADDVERHLDGLPVTASEDSLGYRAGKFVSRNRIAVGAAAAVVLALVVALIAALRGERLAREQAEHARIEADSFHGIADFLMDTFLATSRSVDEATRAGRRNRVLQHADRVRRQHADDPHLRANLLNALGDVCLRLDLIDDAEKLAREAYDVRVETFGERSLEVALSHGTLGRVALARDDREAAVAELERALWLHRTCATGTHTDVATAANDLAVALRRVGRLDESWELHREALALRRAAGPGTLPVAESLNNVAGLLLQRGEIEAAVRSLAEALAIRRDVLGSGHLLALQTLSNLATATWRTGAREESARLLEEAVAGLRELHLEGREDLERALANLSRLHMASGDLDTADELLAEALDLRAERLGPAHPEVTAMRQSRAVLLHHQGRESEAAATWEQVVAQRRADGATAVVLGRALYEHGVFLVDVGRLERAEPTLREAVDVLAPLAAEDPAAVGRAEVTLGACLMRAGHAAEAATWIEAGLARLEDAPNAGEGEIETARGYLTELRARGGG